MGLDALVKALLAELSKLAKADGVTGRVRDAGGAKVLPLSKVSIGFGTAMGGLGAKGESAGSASSADASAGGAGGAILVEPRAFVVVGADGVPRLLSLAEGKEPVLRGGVEILPRAALGAGAGER